MPRSYSLGRRAEQQAETRQRIVAAALTIYRERGMRAATTQAVAAAADVAPGTVRNHFPRPTDLAEAAAEVVLAELRSPGVDIYDGLTTVASRVDRLAWEVGGFFERSASWWTIEQGDPDLAAAWAGSEAEFLAHLSALMRAAFDPVGGDAVAAAVLGTVVGYPTYFALRGEGLSSEEAIGVELSVILPWLEARLG